MKIKVKCLKSGRWADLAHEPQIDAVAGEEYHLSLERATEFVEAGLAEFAHDKTEAEAEVPGPKEKDEKKAGPKEKAEKKSGQKEKAEKKAEE